MRCIQNHVKFLALCVLLHSCFSYRHVKVNRFPRPAEKQTQWDSLIYRLKQGNDRLKNDVHIAPMATKNEVHNLNDYYMDQEAVRRAWSKDKKVLEREREVNLHIFSLATQNVDLVLKTAACREATRRCLDVHKMSFNGNSGKKYWPNCAIVYKCGHDSGCCKNPEHTCSPVKSELIKLHFFSFDTVDEDGTASVERLTFENHTLCDCRPMQKNSLLLQEYLDCLCPEGFFPSKKSLECRCDCAEKKDRTCRRIKKGKRSYPLANCGAKSCSPAVCEYGTFKEDFSRCPRKKERRRRRRGGLRMSRL